MGVKSKLLLEQNEGVFPIKLGLRAHELMESHTELLLREAAIRGENKPKMKDVLNYMFKKSPHINAEEFFSQSDQRRIKAGISTTVSLSPANRKFIKSNVLAIENYAILENKKLPSLISVYNYLLEQVTEIDPDSFFFSNDDKK